MSLRKAAIGLILLFFSVTAFAQDECELTLTKATDEFNAGHLAGIPAILSRCLEQGQNREWRQRAYLLLAETYLLLEDPIGAEKSYLEVLRANPEFLADEKRDPIDLVYLSSKFTATPIFTLSARFGTNVAVLRTILERSLSDDNTEQSNTLRPGFQAGLGVDWNYNDQLSLALEGNYVFSAYRKRSTGVFQRDVIEILDRQSWVRFPLAVKYSDIKGKYRPYGYTGFSLDLLLRDQVVISSSDQNLDPANPPQTINEDRESPIMKFDGKRNTLNYSWFIGGGVKYKVNLDYVFLDLRYSVGFTNLVDERNNIYNYGAGGSRVTGEFQDEAVAALKYAYIDDYFRMDHIFLSFGYIHPLYHPRKLKKARSKSVMRTIKKQDK